MPREFWHDESRAWLPQSCGGRPPMSRQTHGFVVAIAFGYRWTQVCPIYLNLNQFRLRRLWVPRGKGSGCVTLQLPIQVPIGWMFHTSIASSTVNIHNLSLEIRDKTLVTQRHFLQLYAALAPHPTFFSQKWWLVTPSFWQSLGPRGPGGPGAAGSWHPWASLCHFRETPMNLKDSGWFIPWKIAPFMVSPQKGVHKWECIQNGWFRRENPMNMWNIQWKWMIVDAL